MIHTLRRTAAVIVSLSLLPAWPVQSADTPSDSSSQQAQTDRASLDNMLVGPDQVQIHLSRPAKYNTFTTANPPRIILEILGSIVNVKPTTMAGQGTNLKRVRAGQFQSEPEPVARVVLYLKQLTRYTVTPDANMIVVKLESAAEPEAAAPAAATVPVVAANTVAAAPPTPATDLSSNVPDSEQAPAPAVAPVSAPTPAPVPAYVPAPAPVESSVPTPHAATAVLPYRTTTQQMGKPAFASDVNSMATQNSVTSESKAPLSAATTAVYYPQQGQLRISSTQDILQNLPKDTVSLDLQDTDIGDVLKLLAAKANINIIYGADVSGTISLHLNNVPFSEAFDVILGMKNLMIIQAGSNTLRVVTAKQLATERTNTVGVTQVFKVYYQDAADVKRELDSVRAAEKRNGQSVLDVKNNEIILTDSPDGLASAERLIAQIDVRPQQVMIETKLVEVDLSKELDFGVQWSYYSQEGAHLFGQNGTNYVGGNPGITNGVALNTPLAGDKNANITVPTTPSTIPGGVSNGGTGVSLLNPVNAISAGSFSWGRVTNNYILNATLAAAAAKGKVKVLSDPKIATVNGKQATINITTQQPFATTNSSATGAQTTTINYTTTGIQLTVTPLINADGRISLHLTPNVSKPSATAATGGAATAGAISTDTRQADINIIVRDGETIVIGGIITDELTDNEVKVPFLGDIPIIGWLFKNKHIARQRSELLIFVTTKLLAD